MESQVSLKWVTPNAEAEIIEMARVSAPENAKNLETGSRLLRYLVRNKHWSPFEMANMCVEILTTRGISPQILRHRSFTFQEFSFRYANANKIGSLGIPQLRSQDKKNRQNSINDLEDRLGGERLAALYRRVSTHMEDAQHLYQELLSEGVAKESARFVLPLSAPSKLFMNGTLRSWLHYIDLRTSNGTQLEHKQIANQCKTIFTQQFPIISEAMWPQEQEVKSN
jgi:thymidylate synthase (FAD)